MRLNVWLQTEDGAKGRKRPEPVPLTTAEKAAAKPESEKYDVMTLDEALRFLGWDRPSTN